MKNSILSVKPSLSKSPYESRGLLPRTLISSRPKSTLTETLVGLTISAVLLAGLCAAIQASVDAYRKSSSEGVNRLTSRLIVERLALLVRTGKSFGPLPAFATDSRVESDTLELTTLSGQYVTCLLYTSPSPRDATLSRIPSYC